MADEKPDYERFLVSCGFEHWKVYLHMHQQYLGRVYAAAKRDNASGFADTHWRHDFRAMHSFEREELFEIVMPKVQYALGELWRPDRFNYAELENEWEHLHIHIIPRYKKPRMFDGITFTDARWGKNYAPYDKAFKVPEETLMSIRDKIQQALG